MTKLTVTSRNFENRPKNSNTHALLNGRILYETDSQKHASHLRSKKVWTLMNDGIQLNYDYKPVLHF